MSDEREVSRELREAVLDAAWDNAVDVLVCAGRGELAGTTTGDQIIRGIADAILEALALGRGLGSSSGPGEPVRAGADAPNETPPWEHTGYECEILQDGMYVAGANAEGLCDVQQEAAHYAMMYGQDGPVEVFVWETGRRLMQEPPAPNPSTKGG